MKKRKCLDSRRNKMRRIIQVINKIKKTNKINNSKIKKKNKI